jgi:hypothetical protein
MFLRRRLGDALASRHRQSSGVVAATPQASIASPSTALVSPWCGRCRLEGRARERSVGKESARGKRVRAEKESACAREGREKKRDRLHAGGREEKLPPAPAPAPSPRCPPLHRLSRAPAAHPPLLRATLLCSTPVRQTRPL